MGNFHLLAIIIFVMLLGSQVQGWVALGNYHNAANPGKCTITNELIIKPGDSVKSPTDCAQITCNSDDGMATITGCGSIAPPENCRWGDYIDMHAPYSQCCLRHAICTDYNDETSAYIDSIKNMLRASIVSNNFK